MPDYFVSFTKLIELDLSGNLLLDIPVSFLQGLSFLESLKASDNELQDVPLCLADIPGIHTLFVFMETPHCTFLGSREN